jgi:cyclopropane fatty-acyl-phospholipid synthase-like methyltransferase
MQVIHKVLNRSSRLRKVVSWGLFSAVRRIGAPRLTDAKRYVATDEVSGQLQFDLLKREGCVPTSKVLEVGCGCLNAGVQLIRYLEKGNYVGIDPNEWLRQARLKERHLGQLIEEKQATFLSVKDFDASELGLKFDCVLSHSVLSHCAHWQLEQFLRNVAKVLVSGGRILASIRLAEGNAYGSAGTSDKKDSMHKQWQYPGGSYFKLSTVIETADKQGLTAVHIPEYTEFYTKTRPGEYHDWIVFSWKG